MSPLLIHAQAASSHKATAPTVVLLIAWMCCHSAHRDHFGLDATHNRLFVSALGNDTEEIIGISAQTVIHSISGVPTPQGVVYSQETNKVFVGSDEGKLYVYDGTTFDLIGSIDFGG